MTDNEQSRSPEAADLSQDPQAYKVGNSHEDYFVRAAGILYEPGEYFQGQVQIKNVAGENQIFATREWIKAALSDKALGYQRRAYLIRTLQQDFTNIPSLSGDAHILGRVVNSPEFPRVNPNVFPLFENSISSLGTKVAATNKVLSYMNDFAPVLRKVKQEFEEAQVQEKIKPTETAAITSFLESYTHIQAGLNTIKGFFIQLKNIFADEKMTQFLQQQGMNTALQQEMVTAFTGLKTQAENLNGLF